VKLARGTGNCIDTESFDPACCLGLIVFEVATRMMFGINSR
jgi:hypothetical protein